MNGAEKKPEIVVFVGPNGSGKSTFTELLKPPIDKIYSRYYRALDLVKDVVAVSDICHIYDNSDVNPFRIFKKRKETYYYQECKDWQKEDIISLTGISNLNCIDLN